MRASRVLTLTAVLALQPFVLFGDGTVFAPDPIGEQAYRAGLLTHLIPLAILACVLLALAVWAVMHKSRHQAKEVAPTDAVE